MDDNVISLVPTKDEDAKEEKAPSLDDMFEQIKEGGLTKGIYIGINDDGYIGVIASVATVAEALLLLETAKMEIMK